MPRDDRDRRPYSSGGEGEAATAAAAAAAMSLLCWGFGREGFSLLVG